MSAELLELIDRIERSHFRTHQDTGANSNALLIWNIVREAAGLPRLTLRDLAERALKDYQQCAGRALQRGDDEAAQQYVAAAKATERDISTMGAR